VSATRISITELKTRFDFYLEQVKAGRTFVITRYGKPVAHFTPELTQAQDNFRLARSSTMGGVKTVTEPRKPRPGGSATAA
jgi:antitoxin (DNA-binding transcriptional repressor) of toxin-antitoxin stability system